MAEQIEVYENTRDNTQIYYEGQRVQYVAGPQGNRGLSVYSGEGPPAFNAMPGETYIDRLTGDIYEWEVPS